MIEKTAAQKYNDVCLYMIGVVFLVLAVMAFWACTLIPIVEMKSVQAHVTRVEAVEESAKVTGYLNYTIDGVTYEDVKLTGDKAYLYEGNTFEVYYKPTDPSVVSETNKKPDYSILIGVICIGSGFALVGVLIIVVLIVENVKFKKLVSKENACEGKIIDVRITDFRGTRANRKKYIGDLEVIHQNGETYLLSTDSTFDNISYLIGEPITVYMDSKNPKKHYIDLNGAVIRYKRKKNKAEYEL